MTATGIRKMELMEMASERAARYLETLDGRSVFPSGEAVKRLAELGGELPAEGTEPAEVLRLLDEIGSPATVASAGRRYFGFVTGGAIPATLAANWLAGAWDQNAGLDVLSPVSAELEEISGRWLVEIFGLPAETAVGFVTGATTANFTALAAARNGVLESAGWDVEADGLIGAPRITVIGGDEIHISVVKALGMLGLGRNRVVRVPADAQGRLRAELLPKHFRADDCVCAGREREHWRVRSGTRNLRSGARRGRMGACGRRIRIVGSGSAKAGAFDGGICGRRFVGDGRAQMAERAVRLRNRVCALRALFELGDGGKRGVFGARRETRSEFVCAGNVAASPRRGNMGGIAIAGAQRNR